MDSRTIKKYVAGVLFGLICLVFVFFGLPQQMGTIGGGIVADVNGEVVSLAEYRELRQRLRQSQGFNISQLSGQFRDMMQQRLNQQALDYLVNDILIFQAAENAGLRVADAEIRDIIVGIDAFREGGVFQRSLYQQYLRNTRKAAGLFEHELRVQKQRQRVQTLIAQSIRPLGAQVDMEKKLRQKKVNVEFLRVSESSLKGSVKVSNAEAEQRLADADFAALAKSDYEAKKADYVQEFEKVKARHILIKIDNSKENAENVAREKAMKIAADLNNDNFADQAKKWSEDKGSAQKGGDLGFFARGRMVKEFEDKAFSLEPGKISEPVKSQFGFHVIQTLEKQDAEFATIRLEVAKRLLQGDKVKEAEAEIVKAVSEGKVEDVISKYNLKWTETGDFDLSTSNIPRLGADDVFFDEVMALLGGKKVSDKLVESNSTKYVMRLKGQKVEGEVAEDDIENSVQGELTAMVTNDWLKNLRDTGSVKVNQELLR